MSRSVAVATCALCLVVALVPALAQAPKQAPKKPPVKPPAKAAPRPEPPPPPPPPDLVVASHYVAGETTTNGTVLMQGARQRVSYESGLASIYQCDAHRNVQLNTDTRVYLVMPEASAAPEAPAPAPGAKHKGGRVTNTTTVVDTGEKKETFGFSARRLKTTVTREFSPDACDKHADKVEIDGWYIELPDTISCMGAPPIEREIRVDPKDASCSDTVTYVRPAASKAYPIGYTMTVTSGTEAPATSTMTATDVKRVKADPAQLDVPADYVEVNSAVQLTLDHRPGEDGTKKPGTIRVGIAPVANKTGQPVTADLSQALLESFQEAGTDVVLLKGSKPAELAEEAKARSCDFILTNTISEMKRPGKGVLGKIAGSNAEALSATIDYQLVAPGAAKPAMIASAHSGTSMLQTAVGAAKRVSQFMTPMMAARYGYMRAFGAMGGSAPPGMLQQTQDPMLSSVFSLIDRATGTRPEPVLTTENGAAAAALQKELDAVVAELKKRG